jgi:hypothetical protein
MRKLIYKLNTFMHGRNGMDKYNKFLFKIYLILLISLWILSIFTPQIVYVIWSICLSMLALYIVFRCFSKNIVKRQIENSNYLDVCAQYKTYANLNKSKIKDRKTHIYKKCPYCKAVLRLKRIKGKHRAACPRCSKSFDVKVR